MSDEMMSSVCSSYSEISLNGEAMSFDVAIDNSMRDIQAGVNELHVLARNMMTMDERSEDYEIIFEAYTNMDSLTKEAIELLKDLKNICKQVVPKKPKAVTMK